MVESGKLERLLNNIKIDKDRGIVDINGEEIIMYPHLPHEGLFLGCAIVLMNIAPEFTKAIFDKLEIKMKNSDGEKIDWDKLLA